jgi:hypothetical protein
MGETGRALLSTKGPYCAHSLSFRLKDRFAVRSGEIYSNSFLDSPFRLARNDAGVREAADRQEEIGNRLRLTHFADRIVEPERIASCIERLDIGMKVISVVMFVCSVAAALICVVSMPQCS